MSLIEKQELIRIAGTVIRVNDIRAFHFENGQRVVYIQNGMRLVITEQERENVQRLLSREVKRIVQDQRRSGASTAN